ncbi:hypothetical protein RA210_U20317 [Rubrivivax sp. A210]|nr:hypothetical protein RA210_U20317 [Rubrivivax sp. A210]
MYRRHGLRLEQDLRPRGLAAGAEHLPRDQLVQQLRCLPGAAHAGEIPQRARQARIRPHPQWFRAGRGPGAGGGAREPPACRRIHPRAGCVAALPSRRRNPAPLMV